MRFIGNAPVDGEVRAIASGALATGDTVVVNADGTVSVVAETPISEALGSTVNFESGYATKIASTFDSNSNKLVIFYQDQNNSQYGTAIVGTVSGSSITFGTPVVFLSSPAQDNAATFDTNSNKAVVFYSNDSDSFKGYAKVGTVSGTSISFGAASAFDSNNGTSGSSAAFDPSSGKIVVAWRKSNNNGSYSSVGTVSGTSISFGSPLTLSSSGSNDGPVNAVTVVAPSKVVLAYRNSSLKARVGTISGTSITVGSEATFGVSTAQARGVSAVFDEVSERLAVFFIEDDGDEYPLYRLGTISGTSISFGGSAAIESTYAGFIKASFDTNAEKVVVMRNSFSGGAKGVLNSGTIGSSSISFGSNVTYTSSNIGVSADASYDSNEGKVVLSYRVNDEANGGRSVSYQPAYTSVNLTSENFVGFANSGYASGQSAALNSTCSVDNKQSGLTAGQTYYVQTDGSLSTTPASPSVVAGTAISSNSIIVKG